jgi:hypothetical protein
MSGAKTNKSALKHILHTRHKVVRERGTGVPRADTKIGKAKYLSAPLKVKVKLSP